MNIVFKSQHGKRFERNARQTILFEGVPDTEQTINKAIENVQNIFDIEGLPSEFPVTISDAALHNWIRQFVLKVIAENSGDD